jgi:predicted transposase/invertase (TIGR01784 family)
MGDRSSAVAGWKPLLRFLKAEKEEEFKMLAEKNPIIKKAYCKLQEMSEDEAARMLYEARLKAQRDEYSRIQGALRKGREEGWKEGREEGLEKGREEGEAAVRRIILEMGKSGMDAKTIAAVTHLSGQEITRILNP